MSTIYRNISGIKDKIGRWTNDTSSLHGYLLISLPVVIFVVLSVIPVLYGVWISLHSGFISDLEFIGLENYRELLFSDPDFWPSVYRGAIYATYSVAIQTIFGVLIALLINRPMKFGNIVRGIVLLPYLVPTVAVAYIFTWLFSSDYGIVNYYLVKFGIIENSINFFSFDYAMHSIAWISSWKWTVFVILLVLARLQSIDPIYYELAEINGANTIQQFFDVTYPNIRNVVFLVILLRGIWMFNKFDMIWLLTAGGPFDRTTTMTIYAYKIGFNQTQFGRGIAITTIMFVLLGIMGILYFYYFSPEEEVEV